MRIGLVNLMPRPHAYEPLVVDPLAAAAAARGVALEVVRIGLRTHASTSADPAYAASQVSFAAALARGLDGVIVTGAPVEELPFAEVRYWPELAEVLTTCRARVASTLGLCWGGLAIAQRLGIPKLDLPRKVFGVYAHRALAPAHPLLGDAPTFACAHSRHAGIADAALERAAAEGTVQLLAHAPATGYALFATPDARLVAHLGHPEYVAARLAFEWERDRAAGRPDVGPPHGLVGESSTWSTTWADHRATLLAGWLALLR